MMQTLIAVYTTALMLPDPYISHAILKPRLTPTNALPTITLIIRQL